MSTYVRRIYLRYITIPTTYDTTYDILLLYDYITIPTSGMKNVRAKFVIKNTHKR